MGRLTYAEHEYDVTKLQGTMDLICEAKDGYLTAGAVSDKEWVGMYKAVAHAKT